MCIRDRVRFIKSGRQLGAHGLVRQPRSGTFSARCVHPVSYTHLDVYKRQLQLCNDRRGIWLTVAEGLRGIHVNGRPVLQLAMLRAGDSIHADGQELQLMAAGTAPVPASATRRDDNGTLRLVLRGVGGPHHGRSLSLERPRRIGSAANADLRIEGHGISAEHARIEMTDGKPVLRDAAASVRLNGQPVQQALLKPCLLYTSRCV